MLRYLAGLATGTAATTAGLWLLVAPFALGHAHPRIGRPAAIDLMAGAIVATLGLLTVASWSTAWRDRLRADGILRRRRPPRPRPRPARPAPAPAPAPASPAAAPASGPASVPTTDELRELLSPLLAALTAQQPEPRQAERSPEFRYQPPKARQPEPRTTRCADDTRSANDMRIADDSEEAW